MKQLDDLIYKNEDLNLEKWENQTSSNTNLKYLIEKGQIHSQ